MQVDTTEILKIVEMMSRHDLTEIDIKSEDGSLTIKRERKAASEPQFVSFPPMMSAAMPTAPLAAPAAPAAAAPAVAAPAAPAGTFIEAPLVGTFYAAPSPDANAFVKIGDRVTPDSVVCIVEAMKVMNEIKAEKAGTIKEILVENGQAVAYGQPLFRLEA